MVLINWAYVLINGKMKKKNRINIYDVVEAVGVLIFIVFCVFNDDVWISFKIKVKVRVVVLKFGF